MLLKTPLHLTVLLLSIAALSLQVDITIEEVDFTQFWNNHLPGICCYSLRPVSLDPQEQYNSRGIKASFKNLLASDIAVVWAGRSDRSTGDLIGGCSGRAIATHVGPARRWEYAINRRTTISTRQYVFGANYLSHPQVNQLPPSASTSNWLDLQGFRELAWGGGQWFAKGELRRRLDRRGITSSDKGTALFTNPTEWKYPDLIEVNGTNYTDNDRGDLVYRSKSGVVLDLAQLGN